MELFKIKNLHKVYINEGIETQAVRGISFSIREGEFVAIMGPSGSGKSTLMQILSLLDQPTSGEYLFEGKNTENIDDDQRADIRNKRIGFVFQSFNLLSRTTVYENVELPLLYNHCKFNKNENKKKVTNALKSVMLEHRINYRSNQLSGGEKQRVAIARSLVNNPDIIFADEPTGNLDSRSGLQIMKILQKLNDQGKTVVLVTHETYTARHAKRILQIVDGKIVEDVAVLKRRVARGEKILK